MSREKSLFRAEAMKAHSSRWMGELSIVHPLPIAKILLVATGTVLLLGMAAAAATFRQYVTVSGSVVPSRGSAVLLAPADGVVTSLAGPEGFAVRAGDPLAYIDSGAKTRGGDISAVTDLLLKTQKESIVDAVAVESSQLADVSASIRRRKYTYSQEIHHLQTQLKQAKAQAAIAAQSLVRMNALLEQRLISALDQARAETDVLSRQSAVSELERRVVLVHRELAELDSEETRAKWQHNATRSDLARRALILDQERAENGSRAESVVRSPVNGTIGAWAVVEGESVSARAPLLTLLPIGSTMDVHLTVPPSAIGQIEVGQAVSVACDAFPYQRFGRLRGHVKRISLTPVPGPDRDPAFRVVVALESDRLKHSSGVIQLRSGMTVKAEVYIQRSGLLANWFGAARELLRSVFL